MKESTRLPVWWCVLLTVSLAGGILIVRTDLPVPPAFAKLSGRVLPDA